jgi:hypothetical protein
VVDVFRYPEAAPFKRSPFWWAWRNHNPNMVSSIPGPDAAAAVNASAKERARLPPPSSILYYAKTAIVTLMDRSVARPAYRLGFGGLLLFGVCSVRL